MSLLLGKMRNMYKILVKKPEGKRPLSSEVLGADGKIILE
jgi:hypothetical protein